MSTFGVDVDSDVNVGVDVDAGVDVNVQLFDVNFSIPIYIDDRNKNLIQFLCTKVDLHRNEATLIRVTFSLKWVLLLMVSSIILEYLIYNAAQLITMLYYLFFTHISSGNDDDFVHTD